MNEPLTTGLTDTQRDILLCGLRYVRSSVLLQTCDPSPEDHAERENQLREIESLTDQLRSVDRTSHAGVS